MIGPLSGFQGINNLSNMDKLNNLNNVTGNYGSINKLDDFLAQGDTLTNPENLTKIENDPELKADLQGLIEKNQDFDKSDLSSPSEITTGEVASKFSDVLGNYINNVNAKNRDAEKAVETFVSGGNIDMHSVMIAAEKANLSMQLAVQMKNKIVQAYQEVSRIQI